MNIKDKELSEFFNDFSKNCKKVTTKTFAKNEIITTYIAKRKQLCLLKSGEADLIRYDFNGNKTIVEHYIPSNIFGEIFFVTQYGILLLFVQYFIGFVFNPSSPGFVAFC